MRIFFIFITLIVLDLFATMRLESALGHNTSIAINYISGVVGLLLVRKGFIRNVIEVFKKIKNKEKILNEGWEALSFFISGVFFLIPGIATDFMGALLLIPLIRKYFINKIKRKH